MGYDLYAKNTTEGEDYFRATAEGMTILRYVMAWAGVRWKLINRKFFYNDGLLVTDLQAKNIAARLSAVLKKYKRTKRDLWVEIMAEDAYCVPPEDIVEELYVEDCHSMPGTLYININKSNMRFIRAFAKFCEKSRGFRVW